MESTGKRGSNPANARVMSNYIDQVLLPVVNVNSKDKQISHEF